MDKILALAVKVFHLLLAPCPEVKTPCRKTYVARRTCHVCYPGFTEGPPLLVRCVLSISTDAAAQSGTPTQPEVARVPAEPSRAMRSYCPRQMSLRLGVVTRTAAPVLLLRVSGAAHAAAASNLPGKSFLATRHSKLKQTLKYLGHTKLVQGSVQLQARHLTEA